MNELIVRDSSLANKHQFGESDEPATIHSSDWHDNTTSAAPLAHP